MSSTTKQQIQDRLLATAQIFAGWALAAKSDNELLLAAFCTSMADYLMLQRRDVP